MAVITSYQPTISFGIILYAGSRTEAGSSFTISSATPVTGARMFLTKDGSPTGNVTYAIYNSTGTAGTNATPTGTALAVSSAIPASSITAGGYNEYEASFTGLTLSPGTYFVVAQYSGGSFGTDILVGGATESVTGQNGSTYISPTWTSASSNQYSYTVLGPNYKDQIGIFTVRTAPGSYPTNSIPGGWGASSFGMQSPGEITRPKLVTVVTDRAQTGKFRVFALTSRAQTGKFRVTGQVLRTQTGVFRTQGVLTRNQTGIFRVALTSDKNQSGTFRVTSDPTWVQPGVFRVQGNVTRNQNGVFSVSINTLKPQTGVFRVYKDTLQTQTGKFNVYANYTKDQTGKFWVYALRDQDQTGQFRVSSITLKSQTGKFTVNLLTDKSQNGVFRTYNKYVDAGLYIPDLGTGGTLESTQVDDGNYVNTLIQKGTY